MNPLIEKTVKRIRRHVRITDSEAMYIAVEIGNSMIDVVSSLKENANANFKGGTEIDCNTVGNFEFKRLDVTNWDLSGCNSFFDVEMYLNKYTDVDTRDMDVDNFNELILCPDCKRPNNKLVKSKSNDCGYYGCMCKWGTNAP